MLPVLAALVLASSPLPSITEARAVFYRKALPEARQFAVKSVPEEELAAEDRGNEAYVEARDAGGLLVGYLRDFQGPISATPSCPCHALSFTIALDKDLHLKTLISEAPLEKYGHAPMTPADMARLVEIAKNPPELLMKAPRPEDVVDAVTGATKTEYREMVVSQAALTTRRVSGLVQDTVRLVRGAPLARDRQALATLLTGVTDPDLAIDRIAEFLPSAESDDVRGQAFDSLAYYYAESLAKGHPRKSPTEAHLLEAGEAHPNDLARACQHLANRGTGLPFVQECLRRLAPVAAKIDAGLWAILRGTEAFESGRTAESIAGLEAAANAVSPDVDPALHLRLVQALSTVGRKADGCLRAKALFRDEPRYPGAIGWLSLCPEPDEELVSSLREERRKKVLLQGMKDATPLPKLTLKDEAGKDVSLDLSKTGHATVLIFFAAWCPHCQAAFPAFKEFASWLSADASLKDRASILGIRTLTSRDVEPWSSFAARFQPNFTVMADTPDGQNLKTLAASYGFSASIPRMLVVDKAGVPRYLIDQNAYHDLSRELLWTTEDVAKQDP